MFRAVTIFIKVFTTLPLKKGSEGKWVVYADFFAILTVFSDFFSILITNKDPINLGKVSLNIFKDCVPP